VRSTRQQFDLSIGCLAAEGRNNLIAVDLLRAIKAGRSRIFLTERTSHVDEFATRLVGLVKHIVVLKGGMGAKQRRTVGEQLQAIPRGEERVLIRSHSQRLRVRELVAKSACERNRTLVSRIWSKVVQNLSSDEQAPPLHNKTRFCKFLLGGRRHPNPR